MNEALYFIVDRSFWLLQWLIIIWVIMGLLIAFNVVNARNPYVSSIMRSLNQLFEPMLRPIRRILPNMGALDLSPAVLMILVIALRMLVVGTLARVLF